MITILAYASLFAVIKFIVIEQLQAQQKRQMAILLSAGAQQNVDEGKGASLLTNGKCCFVLCLKSGLHDSAWLFPRSLRYNLNIHKKLTAIITARTLLSVQKYTAVVPVKQISTHPYFLSARQII